MRYFSENADELRRADALAMEIDLAWRDLVLPASIGDYPERFKGQCNNKSNPFHIFFISSADPPFGLWCQCHGHIDDGRLVYLQINLDRKPRNPNPPEEWARISDELGGYPKGLNALLTDLHGQCGPCQAELDLFFQKPLFKISRRKLPKEISPFRAVSQTLNLEGPDELEVGVHFPTKGGALVNIETKFELAINQECFETACTLLKDKLTPLMRPL
jgi:hypothetical protein